MTHVPSQATIVDCWASRLGKGDKILGSTSFTPKSKAYQVNSYPPTGAFQSGGGRHYTVQMVPGMVKKVADLTGANQDISVSFTITFKNVNTNKDSKTIISCKVPQGWNFGS